MGFRFPHTVTVKQITQTPDATTKVRGNPVVGSTWTISADIQRMSTEQMFKEYGIELKSPARMFISSADISKFAPEYRVTKGSDTWYVKAETIVRDGGGALDGGVILMEGLQVP
jgi:hypothetical protein